jgi:antitoxin component of RelBE/YafQ-DinJ toxin-antitoxin module
LAEKKQLNTTINGTVLDSFKTACDDYNLKMNTVLEALLQDFSNGDYDIIISRNNGIKIVKK